jgi:membrane fusion protein, copper/silver efflux system
MNMKTPLAILTVTLGLFLNVSVGGADQPVLMEPVKSVLDHYLMIQTELAKDSLKGVDEHADAIAKAVRGDQMKMLSPEVAKQAETLAKAKDLKAAREAFKPLSASLIKYLADNKAGKGVYREGYCPMVKASWLQKETDIKNPYMGKAMLACGQLKN